MKNFLNFIREQGVVGFATGFILGTATSDLVKSFMADIINPFIGLALGSAGGLKAATLTLAGATIAWGNFISSAINFVILAAVVYLGFKILRLEKLDKQKQKTEMLS